MNDIIKQLSNRKSIRQFTGEAVKKEDLDLIIKTAQRTPTSINGQQISLIYTTDKAKIKEIATLVGGQPQVESAEVFIMIVVDFNRTDYAVSSVGKKHVIEQSAEGILVGAVDAGIMLNALQISAESLGYGTTAIGAVRNNPNKFIEILDLPKKTYPIVGTTIGVPTTEAKDAPLKPRVPVESFAFEDKYDDKAVKDGIEKYEGLIKEFREKYNMDYLQSHKESMATYYSNIYFRENVKALRSQGFEFQDEL